MSFPEQSLSSVASTNTAPPTVPITEHHAYKLVDPDQRPTLGPHFIHAVGTTNHDGELAIIYTIGTDKSKKYKLSLSGVDSEIIGKTSSQQLLDKVVTVALKIIGTGIQKQIETNPGKLKDIKATSFDSQHVRLDASEPQRHLEHVAAGTSDLYEEFMMLVGGISPPAAESSAPSPRAHDATAGSPTRGGVSRATPHLSPRPALPGHPEALPEHPEAFDGEWDQHDDYGEESSDGSQIGDHDVRLANYEANYELLQSEFKDLDARSKKKDQEIDSLKRDFSSVHQSFTETTQELKQAQGSIEQLRRDLEAERAHGAQTQGSLASALTRAKAEHQSTVADLKTQLGAANADKGQAIARADAAQDTIRELRAQLAVAEGARASFDQTNIGHARQVGELETDLTKLRSELVDSRSELVEMSSLRSELAKLQDLQAQTKMDKGFLQIDLTKARKDLEQSSSREQQLGDQLSASSGQIAELTARNTTFGEEYAADVGDLKGQLEAERARSGEAEAEVARLRDLASKTSLTQTISTIENQEGPDRDEAIEEEPQLLRSERDEALSQLAALKVQLKENNAAHNAQVGDLSRELTTTKENLEKSEYVSLGLEYELTSVREENVADSKSARKALEAAGRKLGDLSAELGDLSAETDAIRAQLYVAESGTLAIQEELDATKTKLNAAQGAHGVTIAELAKAREDIQTLREDHQNSQAAYLGDLEELQQDHETARTELESQLAAANASVTAAEAQLESVTTQLSEQTTIGAFAAAKLVSTQSQMEQLEAKLEIANQKIDIAQQQAEQQQTRISELESRLETAGGETAAAKDAATVTQEALAAAKSQLENQADLNDVIVGLRKELELSNTGFDESVLEMGAELDAANARADDAEGRFQPLTTQLSEAEARASSAVEQFEHVKGQLTSTEEINRNLRSQLADSQKDKAFAQQKERVAQGGLAALESRLSEALGSKTQLQSELDTSKSDAAAAQRKFADMEANQSAKVSRLESQLGDLQKELKLARSEKGTGKEIAPDTEKLESRISALEAELNAAKSAKSISAQSATTALQEVGDLRTQLLGAQVDKKTAEHELKAAKQFHADQVGELSHELASTRQDHQAVTTEYANRLTELQDSIADLQLQLAAEKKIEQEKGHKFEELQNITGQQEAELTQIKDAIGQGIDLSSAINGLKAVIVGGEETISRLHKDLAIREQELQSLKISHEEDLKALKAGHELDLKMKDSEKGIAISQVGIDVAHIKIENSDFKSRITALQKELLQAKQIKPDSDVKEKQEQIDSLQAELADARRKLGESEASEQRINDLEEELVPLRSQLANILFEQANKPEGDVKELRERISALEEALKAQQSVNESLKLGPGLHLRPRLGEPSGTVDSAAAEKTNLRLEVRDLQAENKLLRAQVERAGILERIAEERESDLEDLEGAGSVDGLVAGFEADEKEGAAVGAGASDASSQKIDPDLLDNLNRATPPLKELMSEKYMDIKLSQQYANAKWGGITKKQLLTDLIKRFEETKKHLSGHLQEAISSALHNQNIKLTSKLKKITKGRSSDKSLIQDQAQEILALTKENKNLIRQKMEGERKLTHRPGPGTSRPSSPVGGAGKSLPKASGTKVSKLVGQFSKKAEEEAQLSDSDSESTPIVPSPFGTPAKDKKYNDPKSVKGSKIPIARNPGAGAGVRETPSEEG